jgi:hypothetical protein
MQSSSPLQSHGREHQPQVVVQVETRDTGCGNPDRTAAGGPRRGRNSVARGHVCSEALVQGGYCAIGRDWRGMFIRDQVSRGLKRWHALAHQHHAEDDRGNADDQQQITDTMPTVPLPVVRTTCSEGGIRGHGALLQAELPVQSCTV